ncbi:MAG: hypothetical protein R2754_01010 [Microthrixaceae bacterium]
MLGLLNRNKIKCDACRASNPISRDRCRICTAPLHHEGPTQDTLWSQRLYRTAVSDTMSRSGSRVPGVILLVILGAGLLNFFVLGYGPDWAHRQVDLGGSWKSVAEFQPEVVAELPGTPDMGTAGGMSTARVVVDDHGEAVLDGSPPSPNALLEAKNSRRATLILAKGDLGGQTPEAAAGERVRSLLAPNALSEVNVRPSETTAEGWSRVDVTGTMAEYPDPGRTSGVNATLLADGDLVVLAVTLNERSPVPGLPERLVAGVQLTPTP